MSDHDKWSRGLTAEEYFVTRQKGTERPFSHPFWNTNQEGTYSCKCCGAQLFSSENKFHSKSGWPAFTKPTELSKVVEIDEPGWFGIAKEVMCASCDAHLGHVFKSEETPTDLHYCINGTALKINDVDD
jgi:peptide-methionine (R)-S-oxide reductase